jgi:CheY-like chemotaxis protein
VPSLRILIVDDNQDHAETTAVLLRLSGHDVHVAHDGHKAIEAARRIRPDIVFLDIGLPGVDGFQVARVLRAEPGLERVRIIALTGLVSENDRQLAREAGIDQHIAKPADPAFLESLLGAKPG